MAWRERNIYKKHTQRRNNLSEELQRDWTETKEGMIRRFATQGFIPEPKGGMRI